MTVRELETGSEQQKQPRWISIARGYSVSHSSNWTSKRLPSRGSTMYLRLERQRHHRASSVMVARQTRDCLPSSRCRAFGMAVHQGRLAAGDLRLNDSAQVVRDDPAVLHSGVEKKPLADRVHRKLQDPGEPIAFPREEGKVVVVELKIRRVFVAERLDGVIQAGVPAPMGRGEACRREARVAKHPIRTFQVAKISL